MEDLSSELHNLLPIDLLNREELITKSTLHLGMIEEVNAYMNLTRITSPREAAIKHVLDSVMPWRLFAGARSVLDAGTGAGFPGIPLAILFPETRFILAESVQKKARFVESVVEKLGLANCEVSARRAEDLLITRKVDIVTARAVAPVDRAIGYFLPGLKNGARALLYKGPDVETEIEEARKRKVTMRVVQRYDLPDAMGSRTVVEICCCVMQCSVPSPQTSSMQLIPVTIRSGKQFRQYFSATRSFGSLNVGTSTSRFAI